MTNPKISVVMPVHNALPFLAQSIESILNQTYQDFEFVILDDCSTDGSVDVIHDWAKRDSRIRVYEGDKCLGLVGSSNDAVSKSKAGIIARMDADDISHPDRLRQQLRVLEDDVNIAVVGTLSIGIDAAGHEVRPRDRWRIVRRSDFAPFPHGSVMFRRSAFDATGGYRESPLSGEDHDLFRRMAQLGSVVTLPGALYSYRYHTQNTTINSESALIRHESKNGQQLAAYYMLGAMRLWAGHKPMILRDMISTSSLKLNRQSIVTLFSASWGSAHPDSLRAALRLLIRSRDFLAGLRIKEGKPYEWRLR